MKEPKKFLSGPGYIFNPVPVNREEAVRHGNALAASDNYPVGTSDCFNVGISGGCGPDCFSYLEGQCTEPDEMVSRLSPKELSNHYQIYPRHVHKDGVPDKHSCDLCGRFPCKISYCDSDACFWISNVKEAHSRKNLH